MDGIRTESLRQEQAKLQLEQRADREIKDVKEKQKAELERLIEHHEFVKQDLEKAYSIDISTTRDEQERKLGEVRNTNQKQLEEETVRGETELDKVRSRFQEQIARYKLNAEKHLEELRRNHDASEDLIKRAQKKEKA
jgi:hypothetical protein